MVNFKNISITIQSDGEDLKEHRDPALGAPVDRTTTVFVEAKPRAKFAIKVACGNDIAARDEIEGVTFEVFIDNVSIRSWVYNGFPDAETIKTASEGIDGKCFERDLFFKDLILTGEEEQRDRDPSATIADEMAEFGNLRIECYRVSAFWTEGVDIENDETAVLKPDLVLMKELIKHNRSLGLALGDRVPSDLFACETEGYDAKDNPFAIFNFRYRTRRDLQEMGLIEYTPPPTPLEERSLESLSREEALELLRRKQEAGPVKRKCTSANEEVSTNKRVKAETGAHMRNEEGDMNIKNEKDTQIKKVNSSDKTPPVRTFRLRKVIQLDE